MAATCVKTPFSGLWRWLSLMATTAGRQPLTRPGKTRALLLLVLLALMGGFPHAFRSQAALAPPAEMDPNGERFLFIVDMSEDMESLQPATEAALYEMIGGGLFGQMRSGDTFGLWTFNKETFAGRFSMKVWDQRRAVQQATVAAAFISGLTYEKSSNLKSVTTQLRSVIHAVSNVNIILISDGRSAMDGTPLDKAINADYKAKKRDRSRAKQPFITSLIARDGWIIDHSVVIAGRDRILLPERRPPPTIARPSPPPVPPAKAPASILITRQTNTAQPSLVTTTEPAAPAPKKVMIISSAPPATNTVQGAQPAVSKPPQPTFATTPPPSPAIQEPAPTPAPSPAAPPVEPPAVISQTSLLAADTTKAAATPMELPAASPVSSSVIESIIEKVQPTTLPVSARENPAAPAPATAAATTPPGTLDGVQGVVTPAPPRNSVVLWSLAVGGILMGTAMLILVSVFRRGRTPAPASLITRSMDRR